MCVCACVCVRHHHHHCRRRRRRRRRRCRRHRRRHHHHCCHFRRRPLQVYAFDKVIFPLMIGILEGSEHDDETRQRAASMMSKTFLHSMPQRYVFEERGCVCCES